MSICGCDVPAALLRRRLSACFVLVLSAFASVAVAAAEGGSPAANADSDDILPVSLGRLDGCEFHYVSGMNDGSYPGDLSVAGGSTCDQKTLPYIWRNGSWLQRDMPLDTPGLAGFVTSVSDDHPEQPTHAVWVGDDFFSSAWVSTAGQPAVQLFPLDGEWEAVSAKVSAEGNHIVGGLELNSDYVMLRAVRWSREGDGWSEPEQLGAGLAAATTADGSVVVGNDYYGAFRPRPWVWTATPGGGDLVLLDQDSVAADISHDGSIIVGTRRNGPCNHAGCASSGAPGYWDNDGGQWQWHYLETPDWPEGDGSAWATAVASVNGQAIIVGGAEDQISYALAWIPGSGGDYGAPLRLAALNDDPAASAEVVDVNRHGVAVGRSWQAPDYAAVEPVMWRLADPPGAAINAGHAGAWYNPATAGQGLLIDVEPEDHYIFFSWFTFTPAEAAHPREQHWFTAEGHYSGSGANLKVYETLGGRFNASWPTSTTAVGTLALSFFDCGHGQARYAIDSWGVQGVFPIERVIPGSANVCQQRAANGTQSIDINPGMDGGWHDPSISGQGFLIDAHTDSQGGKFLFLAWLTYGEGGGQYNGSTASGQVWLTAQGPFDGGTATLDAYETTGGSFDDPQAVATRPIGQITLDFSDCSSGGLSYTLVDVGEDATVIERLLPQGQALCDELATAR